MKNERACSSCGHEGNSKWCPLCGGKMLEIAYKTEHDVIVKKGEDDNITGFGYHICCGGNGRYIVDTNTTSDGLLVYTCRHCALRIITDERLTKERIINQR